MPEGVIDKVAVAVVVPHGEALSEPVCEIVTEGEPDDVGVFEIVEDTEENPDVVTDTVELAVGEDVQTVEGLRELVTDVV